MGLEIYSIVPGAVVSQRNLIGQLIWGFRFDDVSKVHEAAEFGAWLFERRSPNGRELQARRFDDPVQGFSWAFHEEME